MHMQLKIFYRNFRNHKKILLNYLNVDSYLFGFGKLSIMRSL